MGRNSGDGYAIRFAPPPVGMEAKPEQANSKLRTFFESTAAHFRQSPLPGLASSESAEGDPSSLGRSSMSGGRRGSHISLKAFDSPSLPPKSATDSPPNFDTFDMPPGSGSRRGSAGSQGRRWRRPRLHRGGGGMRPPNARYNSSTKALCEEEALDSDCDTALGRSKAPVSVVVVDNDWSALEKTAPSADIANAEDDSESVTTGEGAGSHSGGANPNHPYFTSSNSDSPYNKRCNCGLGTFIARRVWPALKHFSDQKFPDKKKEALFKKEGIDKQSSFYASLFMVVSWCTWVGVMHHTLIELVGYLGVCGLLTLPLPVLVWLEGHLRWPRLYQFCLTICVWCIPFVMTVEMYDCHYFYANDQCGDRKFLTLFAQLFGLPTIALLVMGGNRYIDLLATAAWYVFAMSIFYTQPELPPHAFGRNSTIFVAYHMFLSMVSYFRHLFDLRQQLKQQFKAVQAAQNQERQAEETKKRFVSYIFHEVRVPLNTALLAVQNLEGEGVFRALGDDQSDMVHGLMGSLSMMEKVLNDVLSFSRMESGKFVQARKPFEFHKSIQLVALSHRVQAEVTGVKFDVELDPRIDMAAGGLFLGDEMRLRQIASNLVSNALKFTNEGSVRLVTKLIFPASDPSPETPSSSEQTAVESTSGASDSKLTPVQETPNVDLEKGSVPAELKRLSVEGTGRPVNPNRFSVGSARHSRPVSPTAISPTAMPPMGLPLSKSSSRDKAEVPRKVVVRVEIHDTGVGLAREDVIEDRLFSPYVQTEIGRRQGGKGSGLGLALVRQIVQLSGGRLGVDSEPGVGSCFWLELPYTVLPRGPAPPEETDKPRSPPVPPPVWPLDGRRPSTASEEASLLRRARHGSTPDNSTPVSRRVSISTDLGTRRSSVNSTGQLSLTLPPNDTALFSNAAPFAPAGATGTLGSHTPKALHAPTLSPIASPSEEKVPEWHIETKPVDERSDGAAHPDVAADLAEPVLAVAATAFQPLSSGAASLVATPALASPVPPPSRAPPAPAPVRAPPPPAPARGPPSSILASMSRSRLPAAPLATNEQDRPLSTLVVDDDPLTRMLMSRMLKRLGHNVMTAENGQVGLDLILRACGCAVPNNVAHSPGRAPPGDASQPKPPPGGFDIVFLDNQMPLMSGVEVVREARRRGCRVFVVGCTGNALREDQNEYLVAGADALLPKPIHQSSIEEMILEARRRRMESNLVRSVANQAAHAAAAHMSVQATGVAGMPPCSGGSCASQGRTSSDVPR